MRCARGLARRLMSVCRVHACLLYAPMHTCAMLLCRPGASCWCIQAQSYSRRHAFGTGREAEKGWQNSPAAWERVSKLSWELGSWRVGALKRVHTRKTQAGLSFQFCAGASPYQVRAGQTGRVQASEVGGCSGAAAAPHVIGVRGAMPYSSIHHHGSLHTMRTAVCGLRLAHLRAQEKKV